MYRYFYLIIISTLYHHKLSTKNLHNKCALIFILFNKQIIVPIYIILSSTYSFFVLFCLHYTYYKYIVGPKKKKKQKPFHIFWIQKMFSWHRNKFSAKLLQNKFSSEILIGYICTLYICFCFFVHLFSSNFFLFLLNCVSLVLGCLRQKYAN